MSQFVKGLSRPITLLLVGGAFIAGSAVRVAGIEARSLWGDEIAVLSMSMGYAWYPWRGEETEPFYSAGYYRERATVVPGYFSQRLASVLVDDQNAPFYFALLNLWVHIFGTSAAALRSLSIVASVASIPLVYAIGRELGSRAVGIYAAWLFALAPFQVAFGLYNRAYAWLGLLSVLSTLAAVFLSRGTGGRWFAVYAVAAILGVYTHYLFVWILVFQGLLIAFYQRRNRAFLLRFGLVCLTIGAVCALWLPTFLEQLRLSREFGRQTWFLWYSGRLSAVDSAMSLARTVVLLLSPGRITGLCGETVTGACRIDDVLTALFYIISLAVVGLCAWRLVSHLRTVGGVTRGIPDPWVVCLAWAGCTFLGPAISDFMLDSHMVSSHRYFISAGAPTYLAVAMAVMGTRRAGLRTGIAAALLVFALAGSILYLRGSANALMYEMDAREVARHLDAQRADADDLILVLDPGPNPTDFAYYLQANPDFARVRVPAARTSAQEIPDQLRTITGAKPRRRIWYVDDKGPQREARTKILDWLRAHYGAVEATEFTNVGLYVTSLPDPRR